MPNNKKKSIKDIKLGKECHPYSRKAKQLSRAITRNDKKLSRKTKPLSGAQSNKVDKFVWFKFAMDETRDSLENKEIQELIEEYLKREIEGEVDKRPVNFSSDMFRFFVAKEKQDYHTCGIEIPDLTDEENVKLLRDWDGDWNSITKIKTKFIKSN